MSFLNLDSSRKVQTATARKKNFVSDSSGVCANSLHKFVEYFGGTDNEGVHSDFGTICSLQELQQCTFFSERDRIGGNNPVKFAELAIGLAKHNARGLKTSSYASHVSFDAKTTWNNFLNLDTGKTIQATSAQKKALVCSNLRFCGSVGQVFLKFCQSRLSSPSASSSNSPSSVSSSNSPSSSPAKKSNVALIKQQRPRTISVSRLSSHRKKIPKPVRRQVWNTYCDRRLMQGPCFCCSKEIDYDDFELGHVVAWSRGGPDTPDNLRPVCGTCNKSMGVKNMIDFMRENQLLGLRRLQEVDLHARFLTEIPLTENMTLEAFREIFRAWCQTQNTRTPSWTETILFFGERIIGNFIRF